MTWIRGRILGGMSPWFGTDTWNQQDTKILICINPFLNTNNWNSQTEGSCRTQIKKVLNRSWNAICVKKKNWGKCKIVYWQFTFIFFLKQSCNNVKLSYIRERVDNILSHNKPCFQCNKAITNFLVSNTCEIRFHDVIGQSTVPMYSYAKILKYGWPTCRYMEYVLDPYFSIYLAWFSYVIKWIWHSLTVGIKLY